MKELKPNDKPPLEPFEEGEPERDVEDDPGTMSPRLAFAITVSACLTGYLIWRLLG